MYLLNSQVPTTSDSLLGLRISTRFSPILLITAFYWMNEGKDSEKKISIELVTESDSLLHIDYRDTGTGIEPGLIASEVIFEPQFSTKPSGTGLGLAIAGEAAARNGLELKVFESEQGAWFRLQPK